MAIVKSKHAGNFTVLPNEIFHSGLSASAIGMLAYILSLPHDWVIRKSQLMNRFNIGRDALRTILNELEKAGYFLCVKKHGEKGEFEYNYIAYDKPFNGEKIADSPPTGQPPLVEPTLDNHTTTKEIDIQSTNNTKEINAINYNLYLQWFNDITGKRFRTLDEKTKKQMDARIKEGYTKDDFINAITNCKNDKYHQENKHYLTPEFISRKDKFEKYLFYQTEEEKKQSLPDNWRDDKVKLTFDQLQLLTKDQREWKRLRQDYK